MRKHSTVALVAALVMMATVVVVPAASAGGETSDTVNTESMGAGANPNIATGSFRSNETWKRFHGAWVRSLGYVSGGRVGVSGGGTVIAGPHKYGLTSTLSLGDAIQLWVRYLSDQSSG